MGSATPPLYGGTLPGSAPLPVGAFTLQNVMDDARALLQGGDPSPAYGIGNSILQPFFARAYTMIWQIMEQVQIPRVRREFYFLVPAYTTYLDPHMAGVGDLGSPERVFERGGLTNIQIASTDKGSPIKVTTVTPHGLSTNADVTIGQVSGTPAPLGRWFVTVIDATNLTLNGSVSDGLTGTGGVLTTSPERFDYFEVSFRNIESDRSLSSRLLTYQWEEDILRFRGASTDAQIRVVYLANAVPPTSPVGTLGISGAAAFLSTMTAAGRAASVGWTNRANELKEEALGPSMQPDGTGGLLRGFLNTLVKGLQRGDYRKPRYGQRGCGISFGSPVFSGGGPSQLLPGASVRSGWYEVPVFGGMANVDLGLGDSQHIVAASNITVLNYPCPLSGNFKLIIDSDSVGGHTVTFGSRYINIDPTLFGAGMTANWNTIIPMTIDGNGNAIVSGSITTGPINL